MLKLGIQYRVAPRSMDRTISYDVLVELHRDWNVNALELWLWPPEGLEYIEGGYKAEELKRFLEKYNLEPILHAGSIMSHQSPFLSKGDRTMVIKHYLNLAKYFGCRTAILLAMTGMWYFERKGFLRLLINHIASLAETANGLGLRIALEDHVDLYAKDVMEVVEDARKKTGLDNIGINLDAANTIPMGDDPIETTRLFAPYVFHSHVKNLKLENGVYKICPLNKGIVNWAKVIEILKEEKCDAALSVELPYLGNIPLKEEPIVKHLDYLSQIL